MTVDLLGAYRGAGDGWRNGPEVVYEQLADALVALVGAPLAGSVAVDVGAGTGAASRALARAGARLVVAVEPALDMVRHARATRSTPAATAPGGAVVAVAGDACRLPLRSASVDVVVAAFVLSHLPEPALGLREAARVVRPGGVVLASAFGCEDGDDHPVKALVDRLLRQASGDEPPPWYRLLKDEGEARTGTAADLAALALTAGLTDIDVVDRVVPIRADARGLVAYRLGMAHHAGAVARLGEHRRRLLEDTAAAACPADQPLRPRVLMLSSRVAA